MLEETNSRVMLKKIWEKWKKNKNLQFEILSIVLIIIFSISIVSKSLQNDTFYTVKIGEHIKEFGIDMQDPFSWHDNLKYTYPHWLYDLFMYGLYVLGGFKAIYLSTCILSCILGICIYKVNSKLANNKVFSFMITIGAMFLLKGYIAARAQLVTFILFILAVYLIERFLDTRKKRYGLGLIAISLLIANLHVAVWAFLFILFLPYIAEYLISVISDIVLYKKNKIFWLKTKIRSLEKSTKEKDKYRLTSCIEKLEKTKECAEKIKIKREENLENPYKIKMQRNPNVKFLIVIMIICALMGIITPLGHTPYTYLYKTMHGITISNISEHLPLTLAENIPILCTLTIFLAVMIFTKSKIRLSDLFMIAGLTYLMFCTRRQSTMFVLIGSIILNRMIIQMLEIYGICKVKDSIQLVDSLIIAIFVLAVILLSKHFYKGTKDKPYVNESTYPVQASEWILENLDINNIKLFNEYNYGSYLLYKGIPVFIDSRADLYTPEFNEGCSVFSDFINVSGLGSYYGDTFEKYGITHVIVYKNSKINMMIKKADSEKYNLIYSDNNFVIYEIL